MKVLLALLLQASCAAATLCDAYLCPTNMALNATAECPDVYRGSCRWNSTLNDEACCMGEDCSLPDNVKCALPCSNTDDCRSSGCYCANGYAGTPNLQCSSTDSTFTNTCEPTCALHRCVEGVRVDLAGQTICPNASCTDAVCCTPCNGTTIPLYNESLDGEKSSAPINQCVDCLLTTCPATWTHVDEWYNLSDAGWYAGGVFNPVPWKGWDSSFSCCYSEPCEVKPDIPEELNCSATCPEDLLMYQGSFACNPGYAGKGAVDCPSYGLAYATDCASCSSITCPAGTLSNDIACNANGCNTSQCCIPSCSQYSCPQGQVSNSSTGCAEFENTTCAATSGLNDASCCYTPVTCSKYTCSSGWRKVPAEDGTECAAITQSNCTPGMNDDTCCEPNTCFADAANEAMVECTGVVAKCRTVRECGQCACKTPEYVGSAVLTCPTDNGVWFITGCAKTCASYDCAAEGHAWVAAPETIICANSTQCNASECCQCHSNQSGVPPSCTCPPPYHVTVAAPYCSLPSCSTYTCPAKYTARSGGQCAAASSTTECTPGDAMNTLACCDPFMCDITEEIFEAVDCNPVSGGWYPPTPCASVHDSIQCEARADCFSTGVKCTGCDSATDQSTCTNPKCVWNTAGTCVRREEPCDTTVGCGSQSCTCATGYLGSAAGLSCNQNGTAFATQCLATCETYDCYPKRNYLTNVTCAGLPSSCEENSCCFGSVDVCGDYSCPMGWVANDTTSTQICLDTTKEGTCADSLTTRQQCCVENVCAPLAGTPKGMVCKGNIATCRNSQECACQCEVDYAGVAELTCGTPGGIIYPHGCNETCTLFTCSSPKDIIPNATASCSPTCDNDQCCVPDCPKNTTLPDCDCVFPYHNIDNGSWYDYEGPPNRWCLLPSCSTYTCPALHKPKEEAGECIDAISTTACKQDTAANTRACCDEYWVLYEPGSPGVHLSRELVDFDLEALKAEVVDDLGLECDGTGVGTVIDWRNSPPGKVVFALEVTDTCMPSTTQSRCIGSLPLSLNMTQGLVADMLDVSQNRVTNFAHLTTRTVFTLVDRSGKVPDSYLCTRITDTFNAQTEIPLPPEYHHVSVAVNDPNLTVANLAAAMQVSTTQLEYFDVTLAPSLCSHVASFILETFAPLEGVLDLLRKADFVCSLGSTLQGKKKGFKGRVLGAKVSVEEVAEGLGVPRAQVSLQNNMEFSFETREDPTPRPDQVETRLQEVVGNHAVVIVEDLTQAEVTLGDLCRLKFTGMDCPPALSAVVTNSCRLPEDEKSDGSTVKKYHYTIAGLASLIVVAAILYRIIVVARHPPMREHSLSLLSTEMTEMNESITAS